MSEHYRRHNIEAIDVINDWELNFNLGNVIKLVSRLNYKNEGKDKRLFRIQIRFRIMWGKYL